jgi:predicted thioesterase
MKLWKTAGVSFEEREAGEYWAHVEDKGRHGVVLAFSDDGFDLEAHFCNCGVGNGGKVICKHIVATLLTIQDGWPETGIALGKTATATLTVKESHTARRVGDGSLDVLATPVMIALMERAACKALAGALDAGQISVGTRIDVAHVAAVPLGAKITATAAITEVAGRKIEFAVTASDGAVEIGKGTHTRVLTDAARFAAKLAAREGVRS